MLEPKIMKYVPKSKVDGIGDAYIDDDGMWIVVKPNWNADRMDSCCHTIHEDNIKDLRYQIAGIRKLTTKEFEKMYHKEALESYNRIMRWGGFPELTTDKDGMFTTNITIEEMVDQCRFRLEQAENKKFIRNLIGFINCYEYK